MFSVNTNLGALAALQSLNNTQSAMLQTQNRVATGKKVSSASDNPAVYAIAQAMTDRLSGLAAVSDNLNFAQSVVGVAQAAATEISSQLATLKNTITQGQQAGIDSTTINNQITSILSNIDSIAKSATFNGVNISGGTGTDALVTSAATSMNVTQDMAGTTFAVSQQDMTTAASGLGLTGLKVTAGGLNFKLDDTAVSTGFDTKTVAIVDNGAGTAASPTTTYTFEFVKGSDAPATVPAATFNASGQVLTQTKVIAVTIDEAAMSVNQMTGKLVDAMRANGFGVNQNADGSLDITGNNLKATGMSTSITGGSLTAVSGSTTAIGTVDAAIKKLNGQISTLGSASQQISGLQNFSSALATSLTTGLGALTDADMAAESARLQSLQTKQQLGIQALSIANQQPQSLLSLFR